MKAVLVKGEGRFKEMLIRANSFKDRQDVVISKAYITNESDANDPYVNDIDTLDNPIVCNVLSFGIDDNKLGINIVANLANTQAYNRAYLTNIHKDIFLIVDFETINSQNVDITIEVTIQEQIEVVV